MLSATFFTRSDDTGCGRVSTAFCKACSIASITSGAKAALGKSFIGSSNLSGSVTHTKAQHRGHVPVPGLPFRSNCAHGFAREPVHQIPGSSAGTVYTAPGSLCIDLEDAGMAFNTGSFLAAVGAVVAV